MQRWPHEPGNVFYTVYAVLHQVRLDGLKMTRDPSFKRNYLIDLDGKRYSIADAVNTG